MKFDLEEQIECAIREKGAKEHLVALEKSIVRQHRKRLGYIAIAASLALMLAIGIDLKLSADIRAVGNAFDPVEGQSGGSEITALMQEGNVDDALLLIDEARILVAEEIAAPSSDDPEYRNQLEIDSQELDLLEAVCYMRQGKYFRAKKLLKSIASSEGHFSIEAERLLGEL